jgi:hypothetical protein
VNPSIVKTQMFGSELGPPDEKEKKSIRDGRWIWPKRAIQKLAIERDANLAKCAV